MQFSCARRKNRTRPGQLSPFITGSTGTGASAPKPPVLPRSRPETESNWGNSHRQSPLPNTSPPSSTATSTMPGRRRRTGPLPSGPPKGCPRVMREPELDSAAADRGPPATADDGLRVSTQVGSIPLAAADAPQHRSPRTTPSPARADTPSPPPGSRPSSSASSSRMSWTLSGSSARSFADVVKGPANPDPWAKLSSRLLNFLKEECVIISATNAYHKGRIISVRVTEFLTVQIAFEHLFRYDEELAYAVFNCYSFDKWVPIVLSHFQTSQGIVKNVVERMDVNYITMARSVCSTKPLKEFIRGQPFATYKSIFGGNFKLCIALDTGMMLYHGILVQIFNRHLENLSWNGEFDLSDMVVFNSTECVIMKKPRIAESHFIAGDLRKIGEIFSPMFKSDGEMALYFDVLQKDLSNASENEVKEKWFWEYILSHPALKGSMVRYHLECGLQRAAEIGVEGRLIRSVLDGCSYSDWKALIPTELSKNKLVADSLHEVFWFKHKHTEGADDPYRNTLGGLLAYIRNFLQHGHEYEYLRVGGLAELEQFVAKTFPQALPDILRKLLRHHKMHENKLFMEQWTPYHSSKSWQQ